MTENRLERVAKAIYDTGGSALSLRWEECDDQMKRFFLKVAQAAIDEVDKPIEEPSVDPVEEVFVEFGVTNPPMEAEYDMAKEIVELRSRPVVTFIDVVSSEDTTLEISLGNLGGTLVKVTDIRASAKHHNTLHNLRMQIC